MSFAMVLGKFDFPEGKDATSVDVADESGIQAGRL